MRLINTRNMEHIKLINAQRAKLTFTYKVTKEKLVQNESLLLVHKIVLIKAPKYIFYSLNISVLYASN